MLLSFSRPTAARAFEWLFEGRLIVEAIGGELRVGTRVLEPIWTLGGMTNEQTVLRWELTGPLLGMVLSPLHWALERNELEFTLEAGVLGQLDRRLNVHVDLAWTPTHLHDDGFEEAGSWLLTTYTTVGSEENRQAPNYSRVLPLALEVDFEPYQARPVVIDAEGQEENEVERAERRYECDCIAFPEVASSASSVHESEPTGTPRYEREDPIEEWMGSLLNRSEPQEKTEYVQQTVWVPKPKPC